MEAWSRVAERDHTEIPISLPWSRLQPFNICSRMMFLEKGDHLFPITVVDREKELGSAPHLLDQMTHAAGFRDHFCEVERLSLQMHEIAKLGLRQPSSVKIYSLRRS